MWYILLEISTLAFEVVLDNFASSLDVSAQKHILLVLDNAAWHTSSKLVLPERVEVSYQPPYTSELQPAEHFWSLSDELVANRCPADLNDLERRLIVQCELLISQPGRVKAHALFRWWPSVY